MALLLFLLHGSRHKCGVKHTNTAVVLIVVVGEYANNITVTPLGLREIATKTMKIIMSVLCIETVREHSVGAQQCESGGHAAPVPHAVRLLPTIVTRDTYLYDPSVPCNDGRRSDHITFCRQFFPRGLKGLLA